MALCGTVAETRLTWQDERVPPETITVGWGDKPAPTSTLLDVRQVVVLAAPGAIVVTRTDAVVGFSGNGVDR